MKWEIIYDEGGRYCKRKEIEIYSFKMDNREIKEYLYEYLREWYRRRGYDEEKRNDDKWMINRWINKWVILRYKEYGEN